MKPNTASRPATQAGPTLTAQAAFLTALRHRVDRSGQITIPAGAVGADELDRVLRAIDRARADRGRR
jgi:hypothetical protein